VHDCRCTTRAEAEVYIREYIEIFYNRQRRRTRFNMNRLPCLHKTSPFNWLPLEFRVSVIDKTPHHWLTWAGRTPNSQAIYLVILFPRRALNRDFTLEPCDKSLAVLVTHDLHLSGSGRYVLPLASWSTFIRSRSKTLTARQLSFKSLFIRLILKKTY
jgi:hypothetical protein